MSLRLEVFKRVDRNPLPQPLEVNRTQPAYMSVGWPAEGHAQLRVLFCKACPDIEFTQAYRSLA